MLSSVFIGHSLSSNSLRWANTTKTSQLVKTEPRLFLGWESISLFHSTKQSFLPLVGTKSKKLQHVSGKLKKRKPRVPIPYWKPVSPNQRDAFMSLVDPKVFEDWKKKQETEAVAKQVLQTFKATALERASILDGTESSDFDTEVKDVLKSMQKEVKPTDKKGKTRVARMAAKKQVLKNKKSGGGKKKK